MANVPSSLANSFGFNSNNQIQPQRQFGQSLAFGNPVQAQAPQLDANGNPIPQTQGDQGFLAQLMRMIGLGDTGDALLGRGQKIDDILNQANPSNLIR